MNYYPMILDYSQHSYSKGELKKKDNDMKTRKRSPCQVNTKPLLPESDGLPTCSNCKNLEWILEFATKD